MRQSSTLYIGLDVHKESIAVAYVVHDRAAYVLVTAGTLWLAFVARNDWSVFPVILGLVTVGLGQGALVTLLFNVLVTASPKELAGDVGSLRGTTQNLVAAMGTAVIGALLVALLSTMIMRSLIDNPVIPPEFKRAELAQRFDLDNINFISNDQLKERLQPSTATPEQVLPGTGSPAMSSCSSNFSDTSPSPPSFARFGSPSAPRPIRLAPAAPPSAAPCFQRAAASGGSLPTAASSSARA
jgi:hypothetical protein